MRTMSWAKNTIQTELLMTKRRTKPEKMQRKGGGHAQGAKCHGDANGKVPSGRSRLHAIKARLYNRG